MNKYKETFGVDISKDVFDVHGSATGYYHYRLAQFLYKNEVIVSVVNPLIIKRFIQMKLAKVKTDKSDAKMICEYALINEVSLYTALTDVQSECLQLFRVLDNFIKHRAATKNKMHGEEVLGIPSKFTHRSLRRNRKHYDIEIKAVEAKILSLVKEDQQQQLTLLTTVPGIGQKTALFLIVVTDGFSKFETASQLCSYVGITPTTRESGSSVRGRARLSKVGNRKLRNLLFLCSFNACKHNKACRELYKRIVNKGKSKKLALIAVANKLLKQCFAIAKSGRPYDEMYVSVLPR